MIQTGFSLYLGSGLNKNREVIEKSVAAGSKMVFTSLHIPEESVQDYAKEVRMLMDVCQAHDCQVMVDISNHTLDKLGLKELSELKDWGFTHLRIDFGISLKEVVELSKEFYIVLNSSTILEHELKEMKAMGADLSRFLACHNFYPKELTGISIKDALERNLFLKQYGIVTMAFVAGDKDLRGPIYAGLPTCEVHRNQRVDVAMLNCYQETASDIICIGDVDISEQAYQQIRNINDGYVELRIKVDETYDYLNQTIHFDRVDSSEHLFRSVQSRQAFFKTEPKNMVERKVGDVCVSNSNYLRYEGELEIMKKDHPADDRINVIGHVIEQDIELLMNVKHGFGVKLLLV